MKQTCNNKLRLQALINEHLPPLEVGTAGFEGDKCIIRPPQVPLFHQVLHFLEQMPAPQAPPPGAFKSRAGTATTLVCLRWGSYFAFLADSNKPKWGHAEELDISQLNNSEMARINIESSAALAEWIELSLKNRNHYEALVDRAIAYLPIKNKTCNPVKRHPIRIMENEDMGDLLDGLSSDDVGRLQRRVKPNPTRIFSNAAINMAWRNGPIEDMHAGKCQPISIEHSRISPSQDAEICSFASDRLAAAVQTVGTVTKFGLQELSWRQVLPFAIPTSYWGSAPTWSTNEASREVEITIN